MPQRSRAAAGHAVSAFPRYAARTLWIRTKEGAVRPFRLNAVQRGLHARLEEQRGRTGRIRALILKARQPGVSTYVEGRYYWQVTRRQGVRAFILTHLRDATDVIFEMVLRFHEKNPRSDKPHTGASNAKELFLDELDLAISSVRPGVTYWIFALYAYHKVAAGQAAVMTAFDQEILTLVISFWFGQRLRARALKGQ